MWLLSTNRAELHYFARSFDAVGGYAILSHTWDGNEQSFQDVRAIGARCRTKGINPRDDPELSPKIRECCQLAERHGYRWVWIDSCCIDKTSSSELPVSEAINLMYKWYQSAEVCYAYLKDVPSDCVPGAPGSAFRKSRWHKRGWTLQELIAPGTVIFLSTDWRELGDRADLAELLEEITRIPLGILSGKDIPAEYSASIRMSWASTRKTTKIEDEAYCLMGLFGVSMPTKYGEGRKAFIRLQNEIMQCHCDMSLFAFGHCVDVDDIKNDRLKFDKDGGVSTRNSGQYLFADSPQLFGQPYLYIPDLGSNADHQYPPLDSSIPGPFDSVEVPHAAVTSYGIKFRLPVATIDGITIAVILVCKGGSSYFGLFLTKDHMGRDPMRPRYFTGQTYTNSKTGDGKFLARMCDLGDDLYNLTFNEKPVKASWSTIYIVPTASHFDFEKMISPHLHIDCNPASPFHIPRWLVDRLIALQFDVEAFSLNVVDSRTTHVLVFHHCGGEGFVIIFIGTCPNADGSPHLWAKVVLMTHFRMPEFTHWHDCSLDHLDTISWATQSKVFGDVDKMVRLSFTPYKRIPKTALVMHLELFGRIFEEMLEEAGISFPQLADLETACPDLNTTITSSQPGDPPPSLDPQIEVIAPHTFSLCQHSSTILRTSFSRILDLFLMCKLRVSTPPAPDSDTVLSLAHTP